MIEILDLSNTLHQQSYNKLLWSISNKRPYDSLDFFINFSSGLNNLICICFHESDQLFLLPGYLKPIHGYNGFVDFISPYGYSGPIISKDVDDVFIINAWNEVEKYFKTINAVTCFLRLSLDANLIGFKGEIQPTMKNIKGQILPEETQWVSFDHKVRKNVNKALREGLIIKICFGNEMTDSDLSDFHLVYLDTMVRNNAQNNFYYSLEAFKNFTAGSGNLCLFSLIYDNNRVVSVEMVLVADETIYSFLGGTLSDSFDKRPNDLLKFGLINWARNHGIKYFVLGGGYGSEDGIFKYKKAFFPNDVVEYNTGRWIISEQSYSDISHDAKNKYNANNHFSEEFESKDYFPVYRKYIN
ncbi:MAG: GNAT family N-acetyltransferase [Paludibacter sp.]